jgi:hypothetical protein
MKTLSTSQGSPNIMRHNNAISWSKFMSSDDLLQDEINNYMKRSDAATSS